GRPPQGASAPPAARGRTNRCSCPFAILYVQRATRTPPGGGGLDYHATNLAPHPPPGPPAYARVKEGLSDSYPALVRLMPEESPGKAFTCDNKRGNPGPPSYTVDLGRLNLALLWLPDWLP